MWVKKKAGEVWAKKDFRKIGHKETVEGLTPKEEIAVWVKKTCIICPPKKNFCKMGQISRQTSHPLLHFHPLPADKSIDIVDQKHRKAHDDRDIPLVAEACKCPQDDEYNIVGCISQTEIRIAAKCQVNGNKTCGDGNRAWHNICGVKIIQYLVKYGGDQDGGKEHRSRFFFCDRIDLDFGTISVVRMTQPGDQGKNGHWHRHSEVSDHFTVIRKRIGNDSVQ